MPLYDTSINLLCIALATAVLVGLLVTARVRACVSFAVYVVSAVVTRVLILTWPGRFFTWDFVFWSDAVQTGLRAAIALEISYKVFRPLPGGFARIRLMFMLVVGAMAIAFWIAPPQASNAFEWTFVLQQVSYGVAFLFGAFLLVTWYHCVPLDRLHLDIAAGFSVLNMVLAFTRALAQLEPDTDWGRNLVIKSAYPLLLAAWCLSAWRRDAPTKLSPASLRRLQPWRVR